jgi:hypothetical protein
MILIWVRINLEQIMLVFTIEGMLSVGSKVYVNPKKQKFVRISEDEIFEELEEAEEELKANWMDYYELEPMPSRDAYR